MLEWRGKKGRKMSDLSVAVGPFEKKIKADLFVQQKLHPLIRQAKNLKKQAKKPSERERSKKEAKLRRPVTSICSS